MHCSICPVGGEQREGPPRLRAFLGWPDSLGPKTQLQRARSRLYRNQILQVNMRLKALAEIYTMHSFALLCNLNFFQDFAKIC